MNPGRGEVFCTGPDRPCGPAGPLYNGYGSFPGVKRTGRGADNPPPTSSAEATEQSCMSTPLWAFVAGYGANFTGTCFMERV